MGRHPKGRQDLQCSLKKAVTSLVETEDSNGVSFTPQVHTHTDALNAVQGDFILDPIQESLFLEVLERFHYNIIFHLQHDYATCM